MSSFVNEEGAAAKGSQRWLQFAVNEKPELLNVPLRQSLGLGADVEVKWLSPLRGRRYVEHRDDFVDVLGLELEKPLAEFWPSGGPVWAGLARVGDQRLLVEAKAHIPEMMSGSTRASEESKQRIEEALKAARAILAPRNTVEWSHWNGAFYQYSNRLAFLDFLRRVNRQPVHLVWVYFLNAGDMNGPTSQAEWEGAIKIVEGYLGLDTRRLANSVHKLFVDVRELQKGSAN
jgi:hypothetical protein